VGSQDSIGLHVRFGSSFAAPRVTLETVRAWELRFAPLVAERLRARRRGRVGESWYLDETYVKVAGRADAQ